MPHADFIIRPMQPDDLPEVVRIQALCYTEIVPESAGSLADKQRLSPDTCLVACTGAGLLGYLLTLPWQAEAPPLLDARITALPPDADCLYLHDLAVDPQARGSGAGTRLVESVLEMLPGRWEQACLVAIQGSQPYWQRYGFVPVTAGPQLAHKLASYGEAVCYMRRLSDRG